MRQMNWIVAGLFLGLVTVSAYAADKPSRSGVTNIPPQAGDEELVVDTLRGKLLKADAGKYTVEMGPGSHLSLVIEPDTKFEENYKAMEGDWIEAFITPQMHVKSIKRSTPAYTMEGDILKVEGNFFVVRSSAGKEVRLQLGKDTKHEGPLKVGDRIKTEYAPNGAALSIKPAKFPIDPGSDSSEVPAAKKYYS